MALDYLCTTSELEAVVGGRPAGADLKSIAFLDPHCEALLAVSPFSLVGVFGPDGSRLVALGGARGHLAPDGATTLALPGLALPGVEIPSSFDGAAAGVLTLIPGYRETLRVNGRLRLGDQPHIDVEEAFLHCAKAIIRSRLWDEPDPVAPTDGMRGFLARSPFVAIASVDRNGRADVSPKGDPAGFVTMLDDATLAIPDRPGNRRTDTMHNLIDRADIALVALVPGDDHALEVRGTARVTDDPEVRAQMAVNGKVPAAAIVIDVARSDLRPEPAVTDAALWDTTRHVAVDALPRASRIWVDHIHLNDDPGADAQAMRALVDEQGLAAGLRHDYETRLY